MRKKSRIPIFQSCSNRNNPPEFRFKTLPKTLGSTCARGWRKIFQMTRENILKFPAGFLWGTATSPTQVEGHIQNEWTNFAAQDGGHCRVACDHYHRYPEDIEWMSKLGVNAYRFGIEWSRLQSAPFGALDQNELARYLHLLDCLQAKGITPMVVLHHFSNPPWINAAGGWTNTATIPAFADYVRKLVAALKGRVYLWNTFNEPDTYACVAYLLGGFPPQRMWRLGQFRRVVEHMARAHVQASRIIRREGAAAANRKWASPKTGRSSTPTTDFRRGTASRRWSAITRSTNLCSMRFSAAGGGGPRRSSGLIIMAASGSGISAR